MGPAKRWWAVRVEVQVSDSRGLVIPEGWSHPFESRIVHVTARGRVKAEKKALRFFRKIRGYMNVHPEDPGMVVELRTLHPTVLPRRTRAGGWWRDKNAETFDWL